MICEGVPLHLIKSQVACNADLKTQNSTPSELLLHAVVLRTINLIKSTDVKQREHPKQSDDSSADLWWEEWQLFAEQFYTFVENGYDVLLASIYLPLG
jgi:hypothetical protein